MSDINPEDGKIFFELGGEQVYADLAKPTMMHYAPGDNCEFAEACFTECDPNGLIAHIGNRTAAEFCMKNAMEGGNGGEYVAHLDIRCKGPKNKIFSRQKKCGAVVLAPEVVTLEFDDKHPEVPDSEG